MASKKPVTKKTTSSKIVKRTSSSASQKAGRSKLAAEKSANKKRSELADLSVDSDADGLSDYQERLYGTDPFNPDSDNDGLSDYEEIKIYQTNPLDPDTNKNGITDGIEVATGRNPREKTGQLRELFFSYAGNSYHPEILKPKRMLWYGSTAIIIKLIVFIFITLLPLSAWVTPDVASNQAKQVIELTNTIRKNLNLPPLKENRRLSQAASDKAQDMLVGQYFAHVSPSQKGLKYWLDKNSYSYSAAGENLALGFSSAGDVVNAWSKSKTHYANIIDPDYQEIGVGVVIGNYRKYETTFISQMFGSPQTPISPTAGNQSITSTTPASSSLAKANSKKPTAKTLAFNKTRPTQTAVLGIKIQAPLTAPALSSPDNQTMTKEEMVKITAIAPQAEKVITYLNGVVIASSSPSVDGYLEEKIKLNQGVNNLLFASIRGQEEVTSSPYVLILDSQPPTIDQDRSSVIVETDKTERIVRAIVFLSPDTTEAEVSFGPYNIKLIRDDSETDKWTGSTIIFDQDEEQIFSPVVLPTLTVQDQAGNSTTEDINWQNVKPVKTSILKQYFFARNNESIYTKWLFGISSIYYKLLLAIIIATLVINIFVQLKKQIKQNKWRVITPSVCLIILLLLLIWI
ncbi:MAG: CAP domain-containing protein [Patescibacteria group bacterium]